MVEKRRGLGRGLGALIPSAPLEESLEQTQKTAVPEVPGSDDTAGNGVRSPVGRPVDLFFESVTSEDVVETPRSYSTALRSGIDRNVRAAQSKRVAKAPEKTSRAVSNGKKKSRSITDAEPAASVSTAEGTEARDDVIVGSEATPEPGEPQQTDVSRETNPRADAPTNSVTTAGTSEPQLVPVPGASFADLGLDSIHPNRKQPRVEFDSDELEELVHSIREVGVLQPVVVRPSQEDGSGGYELVMGERRWRASKEAGLSTIPAIIRSTLDDDLLRDALLENLHRSALNPLEEAAAYQQLLDDFGCSHDELAGRLGRSRPQISNTLRLLRLPPLAQRRVAAGVLTAGHARALLGLGDAAAMEQLAQRIVAEGLSVRTTEEMVALESGLRQVSKPARTTTGARHERLDYLATSLSDRLDTNVKISLGAKKGRVSIEFASVDDLNRIIGVISPGSD